MPLSAAIWSWFGPRQSISFASTTILMPFCRCARRIGRRRQTVIAVCVRWPEKAVAAYHNPHGVVLVALVAWSSDNDGFLFPASRFLCAIVQTQSLLDVIVAQFTTLRMDFDRSLSLGLRLGAFRRELFARVKRVKALAHA
jgi:hypothetical protein